LPYPLTAIISDLHSNLPSLLTAIGDARERGVRRYVCCGDVIGYGARPRECLSLVMELCVPGAHDQGTGESLEDGLCLQGNHELALLGSAEDFNPKARAAIDWTRVALNGGDDKDQRYAMWDFLGAIEPTAYDEVAMFAHGSPREPVREYLLPRDVEDRPKMRACFDAMQRDVCFVGHSHVPGVYYEDGSYFLPKGTQGPYDLGLGPGRRAIVNVGSVGQPRDGDNRLSYVVFDGRALTFVRLAYDYQLAAEQIRAVDDLPTYLADRLSVGR
jgi:diadenosine tetraphosphatase ApaH/serine/threonine PP2A family protein phosphatase